MKRKIFVFGANTQGRHGKGAALYAKNNYGAIYGQSKGLQGDSYAICTKDLTKNIHPSIPEVNIINQIEELYTFAKDHSDLEFNISYTLKPNLNGYSPNEMALMFFDASLCVPIPDNIIFDSGFFSLIKVLQDEYRKSTDELYDTYLKYSDD